MVANVLIDQERVETWVLVEEQQLDKARDLAYRQKYTVLLSNGRELMMKGTSQVNKAVQGPLQNTMLGANVDDLIAREQGKEAELRRAIMDKKKEVGEKEAEKRNYEKELGGLKNSIRRMEVSMNALAKEIKELENFEEEALPDIQETQRSAEEKRREIERKTVELLEVQNKLDITTEKLSIAKQQKEEHDSEIETIAQKNEKCTVRTYVFPPLSLLLCLLPFFFSSHFFFTLYFISASLRNSETRSLSKK
jgi:chromosome segregation ATPase